MAILRVYAGLFKFKYRSVRYKPVIVVEALAYIATWVLLLWGRGMSAMQAVEFCHSFATSTEVAYYTYIYVQVSVFKHASPFHEET